MLNANVPPQARAVCLGDVTGSEDVRIGRAQVLVDDDPLSILRPAAAASLVRGATPTPTMIMSASIRVPSLNMTPVTVPYLPVSSTAVVR